LQESSVDRAAALCSGKTYMRTWSHVNRTAERGGNGCCTVHAYSVCFIRHKKYYSADHEHTTCNFVSDLACTLSLFLCSDNNSQHACGKINT
jgi:hypothetical protein